jgi:hypothetical protein
MRHSVFNIIPFAIFVLAAPCFAADNQAQSEQGKKMPVFTWAARIKADATGVDYFVVTDGTTGAQKQSVLWEDHTTGTATLRIPLLTRLDSRIDTRWTGSDIPGSGSGIFFGDSSGDTAGIQLSAAKNLNFWMDNNHSWGSLTPKMTLTGAGRLGIGTNNPGGTLAAGQEAPLHVLTSADHNEFLLMQNVSNTLGANARIRASADVANVDLVSHASARTITRWGVTMGAWNEVLSSAGNGLAVGTFFSSPVILGTNSIARLKIDGSGTITIGSTAAPSNTVIHGSLTADSVIGAVYQDVAEWVPATEKMSPGTVVVLNREHKNEVMPSARAYDTAVAGVVSAQPGVILGVASDSKVQIATTGRVKVHVDATAGAIAIGDLLVTGNKPGVAMKSQPVDLGGVQLHRPGTVIGKALEPLPDGDGDILVLLSLQ